jgi:hypothetical protein
MVNVLLRLRGNTPEARCPLDHVAYLERAAVEEGEPTMSPPPRRTRRRSARSQSDTVLVDTHLEVTLRTAFILDAITRSKVRCSPLRVSTNSHLVGDGGHVTPMSTSCPTPEGSVPRSTTVPPTRRRAGSAECRGDRPHSALPRSIAASYGEISRFAWMGLQSSIRERTSWRCGSSTFGAGHRWRSPHISGGPSVDIIGSPLLDHRVTWPTRG